MTGPRYSASFLLRKLNSALQPSPLGHPSFLCEPRPVRPLAVQPAAVSLPGVSVDLMVSSVVMESMVLQHGTTFFTLGGWFQVPAWV